MDFQLMPGWLPRYSVEHEAEFEIIGDPASMTAQQKGVRRTGFKKISFYTKEKVIDEKNRLSRELRTLKPTLPLPNDIANWRGPVAVSVVYVFPMPASIAKRYIAWLSDLVFAIFKTTKPDLDNVKKLFFDMLKKEGFFNDDCQIVFDPGAKLMGTQPRIWCKIAYLRELRAAEPK